MNGTHQRISLITESRHPVKGGREHSCDITREHPPEHVISSVSGDVRSTLSEPLLFRQHKVPVLFILQEAKWYHGNSAFAVRSGLQRRFLYILF